MTGCTRNDFSRSWRRFLVELTFLRSCVLDPMPGVPNSFPPQEELQPYIASLFYIRMVSTLDDGLEQHIDAANLPLPRGYRGRLVDKIKLLDARDAFLDATELHRIRCRRNEVAHEPKAKADWQEVQSDSAVLHRELEHLGLVGAAPNYETFGERVPEESDEPGVAFVHRFTCGVREREKEVLRLCWTIRTSLP